MPVKRKRSGPVIMAGLIGLVKPLSLHMALAVLLGTLGHLCAIAIPVTGVWALYLAVTGAQEAAGRLFVPIAACGILRGVLHYGEQNRNHYIAFTLLKIIRDHVFGALRRLAPAKMDEKNKGSLISAVTGDIELLEVFYAHTISPILIALIVCSCMLVFFYRIHPLLMPIALAAYVLVGAVIPILSGGRLRQEGAEVREGAADLSAFILDSLHGLKETLRFAREGARMEEIDARSRAIGKARESLSRKTGFYAGVTEAVILLADLGMLFACAALHQSGAIGLEGVLLAQAGIMSSFGPAAALSALAGSLTHTLAAGDRILDLLSEEPEVEEVTNGCDPAFERMACERVGFSYGGGEKVLDGFDLEVPGRGITGITGRSGTGKSTVLKLLMRFRDVQTGRVTLSGEDVKNVNTASLRACQAYVTQDTELFRDTVENNIRIGRGNASREEVIAAAKKAGIHDFILSLPRGYDTGVGEMGGMLSSGERQRISLARAFLSDAPLILLDEPTSNLDTLSEGRILHSLDEARGEKSIVLVSHRPSVKALADRDWTVEK